MVERQIFFVSFILMFERKNALSVIIQNGRVGCLPIVEYPARLCRHSVLLSLSSLAFQFRVLASVFLFAPPTPLVPNAC